MSEYNGYYLDGAAIVKIEYDEDKDKYGFTIFPRTENISNPGAVRFDMDKLGLDKVDGPDDYLEPEDMDQFMQNNIKLRKEGDQLVNPNKV